MKFLVETITFSLYNVILGYINTITILSTHRCVNDFDANERVFLYFMTFQECEQQFTLFVVTTYSGMLTKTTCYCGAFRRSPITSYDFFSTWFGRLEHHVTQAVLNKGFLYCVIVVVLIVSLVIQFVHNLKADDLQNHVYLKFAFLACLLMQ